MQTFLEPPECFIERKGHFHLPIQLLIRGLELKICDWEKKEGEVKRDGGMGGEWGGVSVKKTSICPSNFSSVDLIEVVMRHRKKTGGGDRGGYIE